MRVMIPEVVEFVITRSIDGRVEVLCWILLVIRPTHAEV
jgi:hypothetical protein